MADEDVVLDDVHDVSDSFDLLDALLTANDEELIHLGNSNSSKQRHVDDDEMDAESESELDLSNNARDSTAVVTEEENVTSIMEGLTISPLSQCTQSSSNSISPSSSTQPGQIPEPPLSLQKTPRSSGGKPRAILNLKHRKATTVPVAPNLHGATNKPTPTCKAEPRDLASNLRSKSRQFPRKREGKTIPIAPNFHGQKQPKRPKLDTQQPSLALSAQQFGQGLRSTSSSSYHQGGTRPPTKPKAPTFHRLNGRKPVDLPVNEDEIELNKPFKARPMPRFTATNTTGGSKIVSRRPTTRPQAPKLSQPRDRSSRDLTGPTEEYSSSTSSGRLEDSSIQEVQSKKSQFKVFPTPRFAAGTASSKNRARHSTRQKAPPVVRDDETETFRFKARPMPKFYKK